MATAFATRNPPRGLGLSRIGLATATTSGMHTRRVVAGALVALAFASCGPGRAREATHATARRGPPSSATTGVVAATSGPATLASPVLSAQAADVAARYAVAQSSYRHDLGPHAWVDAVATLCTPAWLERLRSEPVSPADWDGVVQRGEVASAAVVSVHASRSRVGGQRAVVVVRVSVERSLPSVRVEVVEVELVRHGGHWLVGGS